MLLVEHFIMDIVKAFTANDMNIEITIKGDMENPLFRASDIGEVLQIVSIRTSIMDFDDTEKVVHTVTTKGGDQQVSFLTEKGLYKVLFKSRKKIAVLFQDWVCSLLKEIRLTGKYELEKQLTLQESIIKQKEEELSRLQKRNKVNYEMKDRIYVYEDFTIDNKLVYKIGRSTNLNIRVITYDTTRFENRLIFQIECVNSKILEKAIHHYLRQYQDPEKQEWFHADIETIKKGIITVKLFLDDHNDKIDVVHDFLDALETKQHTVEPQIDENTDVQNKFAVACTTNTNTSANTILNSDTKRMRKNKDSTALDYSLFDRFMEECAIPGSEYCTIAADVRGCFRLWNRRTSKEEGMLLTEYLRKNYKQRRLGVWNDQLNAYQVAFDGFKLRYSHGFYKPSDPPNEYDQFIADMCHIHYTARHPTHDLTNRFLDWKKSKNIPIKNDKREKSKFSDFLARNFLRIVGKFIYQGVSNSGGIWGVTLKTNNVNDATPAGKQDNRRKQVYKIDTATNIVENVYESIVECYNDLDKDMWYHIKNKVPYKGFLYTTDPPRPQS